MTLMRFITNFSIESRSSIKKRTFGSFEKVLLSELGIEPDTAALKSGILSVTSPMLGCKMKDVRIVKEVNFDLWPSLAKNDFGKYQAAGLLFSVELLEKLRIFLACCNSDQ